MIELDLEELRSWFGFGVAGNFAGHLDQAGEAVDFATVAAKEGAPKGIFPWYAPGYDSFLGEFPLSHDALMVPTEGAEDGGPLNLQIEPEVALACREQAPQGWRACLRIFGDGSLVLSSASGEVQVWQSGEVRGGQVRFSAHGWSDFCPLREASLCQMP